MIHIPPVVYRVICRAWGYTGDSVIGVTVLSLMGNDWIYIDYIQYAAPFTEYEVQVASRS